MSQMITFPDEKTYDTYSWNQAKAWKTKGDFEINVDLKKDKNLGGATHFYYFIAIIYYIFGHSVSIAKLFNIFFSIISAFLIYLITEELFNKSRISNISLVLSLFMPLINFWTIPLLRESFNLFFITLAFFTGIKLIKSFKIKYFLVLLICFYITYNIRFHVSFILIFAITVCLLIKYLKKKSRIIFILLLITSTALIIYAQHNEIQIPYKELFSFKSIDNQRNANTYGNYAFPKDTDISTFKNALMFLPKGLINFFFSPFLNKIKNKKEIFVIPNTLIEYTLIPFTILGIFITFNKRKSINCSAILIYCLLIILLYSLIDGNIWLLHRHKIQATFFLFIFSAVGIHYFLKIIKKLFKNKYTFSSI